jgi:excisionase family DNA binding protein
MKPGEKLLTIQQVADMFGVPLSTMYKLARERKIPGLKIGKHWRFKEEIIDKYLQGQEGK